MQDSCFILKEIKFVVEDKQGKQNYYDLEKKAFVYRAFYNSLTTVGAFEMSLSITIIVKYMIIKLVLFYMAQIKM